MADITDTQIEAAIERGRIARLSEPRAKAARYDRESQHVVIELTNGCIFSFPADLGQGLTGATPQQLSQVEVLGAGSGLHWDALDVDLSVPALLDGNFGTVAFLAQQGGQTRTSAKADAA